MSDFKTTEEIYKALCEGNKIRAKHFKDPTTYIHLVAGQLVDEEGRNMAYGFRDPFEWSYYTPPKKKLLKAPAICIVDGELGVSNSLFASVAEAVEELNSMLVSWPATINIEGKSVPLFYEVEE